MKVRVIVQLYALISLLASTCWISELYAESCAVDNLVSIVEIETKGLDQIREMFRVLGEFSESKREWIEENFRNMDNPRTVGTNALTFGVFGIGACGWASELSVICFQRLDYETRLLQILDKHGRAVHIALDISLPNGERVIFDPLLNHLHLDANTRDPLADTYLAEQWPTLCPDGTQAGFCTYSFEYGIRYTNWSNFGPIQSIAKLFFEFLGIESLRAFWLSSRYFISQMVWVMSLSFLLFILPGLKPR